MKNSRKLTNILVICFFLWSFWFSGCFGQQTSDLGVERGSIHSVEVFVNGESGNAADTGDEITWEIKWEVWGNPESSIYNILFQIIDPEQSDSIWAEGWDDKIGDGSRAQKSISTTMPDQHLKFAVVMLDEAGNNLDETDPQIIVNNLYRSEEGTVERGKIISVTAHVNGVETNKASPGDEITWLIKWQVWGDPDTSIYTVTLRLVDPEQPDHVWVEEQDDKVGDGSRARKTINFTMPDQDLSFAVVMLDETGQQLDATDSQRIEVST